MLGLGTWPVLVRPTSIRLYAEVRRDLSTANVDVLEMTELDPFAKDHAAFVVEKH